MLYNLETIIQEKTETEFNELVYKLIELYSLEEICSQIYKSKFMNIALLEMLYHMIVNNETVNSNLVLNNLFIKVVSHNIAKEISEEEVYNIIKNINIEHFNNHICEYNYHNFKESTCNFSIYKSFKMCLFYYLNDIHISYNSYVSEYFIKKNLSRETYHTFKTNTLKVLVGSNKLHFQEEIVIENTRNEHLDVLINSDKNKTTKMKISINNTLLWDQINHNFKENLDINYLFLNNFRKQELIIKANCIVYWEAICKIERWLYWCYWDPTSPFRKKKLSREYDSYKE